MEIISKIPKVNYEKEIKKIQKKMASINDRGAIKVFESLIITLKSKITMNKIDELKKEIKSLEEMAGASGIDASEKEIYTSALKEAKSQLEKLEKGGAKEPKAKTATKGKGKGKGGAKTAPKVKAEKKPAAVVKMSATEEEECEKYFAEKRAKSKETKVKRQARAKRGLPAQKTAAETAKKAGDTAVEKIVDKAAKDKPVTNDIKAVVSHFTDSIKELKKFMKDMSKDTLDDIVKDIEGVLKSVKEIRAKAK